MTRRLLSPVWAVAASAVWMAAAGNLPLWRKLALLGMLQTASGAMFALAMFAIIAGALAAVLGLFGWRGTLKPAAIALFMVTAFASHFMLAYGVVVDPGMVTNTLQTDVHEAAALLTWKLAAVVAVLAVLPGWLLWRQPLAHGTLRRQLGLGLVTVLTGLAVALVAALASFQTLASVMRNHKDVRYLINPLATIYATGRVAAGPLRRDTVLVRVGEDARLTRPTEPGRSGPILLLVLGETGRSGNFSLNGYGRHTTPELEREGAVSFRNAWSCGTSTAASVPCMFSNLTREHFDGRKSEHEGLLDVLQRAGLAVLWIDNQSGCKAVCDRVPSVVVPATSMGSPLCAVGECLDGVMLEGLDERIAALDPQRVARGLVIVMHQMGSHGPAYHLRSPAALKRFLPECTGSSLQDCSRESVINAYDNSIAYTDHVLGQAIRWLRSKSSHAGTALLYVADHGESLGENGLYLHGMPYAVAPDVQKHVPWITWVSDKYQRSAGLSLSCLRGARDKAISHDSYFHSVLGLMSVTTSAYLPALDVYAPCRGLVGEVAMADTPHAPR